MTITYSSDELEPATPGDIPGIRTGGESASWTLLSWGSGPVWPASGGTNRRPQRPRPSFRRRAGAREGASGKMRGGGGEAAAGAQVAAAADRAAEALAPAGC